MCNFVSLIVSVVINSSRKFNVALFIIYSALVLWLTVVTREIGIHEARNNLFWSYRLWLAGNWNLGWQILANIALFVPLGLLLDKKRYLLIPILISISIELIQLSTLRGFFEFDDILNNTLGAVIGWIVGRRLKNKWKPQLGAVAIVALGIAILSTHQSAHNSPRILCFQVEEDGNGFCFRINNPGDYIIKVRGTDGKAGEVKAETGIEREDVAEYFGEEYRFSGFQMEMPTTESEVLICYNPLLTIPTGVYVSEAGVFYKPTGTTISPTLNAPFISYGKLLVYRPDHHCWVYQYEGSLYWVVDKDFYFEENGSTYIQYQLWTTQIEKLPQHRLDNNWLWDNIGGNFEDYELQGDWGEYRVMKREIPTAYSITSILTGYYKNGEWIWKEYFRPYYEFD